MIIKCTGKKLTFDMTDNRHSKAEIKFLCKTIWRIMTINSRHDAKIRGSYD